MPELGESLKFKMRREHIKELERQQEAEDQQSLVMTAEQHALLLQTFQSVKTDFEDLDGLSWECESAQRVLKNWEHKRAILASVARRRSQGVPTMKRSTGTIGTTSGFIPPVSTARTRRPLIPFARDDGTSILAPTHGPRIASVLLSRDASRTMRDDPQGDGTLPSPRRFPVSQSLSDASNTNTASFGITYATLGRSWRRGTNARSTLPSPFLPPRPSDLPIPTPTRKSAFDKYIESQGQDLEPLSSVLLSESEPDCLDDASADQGLGIANVLGSLGTQINETAFSQDEHDESSELRDSPGRKVPPPILAASPRLGGSANTLWNISAGVCAGSRHASLRLGGSPRLAGSAGWLSGVAGSPTSPRSSLHHERCSISRCRTGRRRVASHDVFALQH